MIIFRIRIFALIAAVLYFFLSWPANANQLAPTIATPFNGMVVSSQAQASQAGLRILQQGGNAIDAAVAVGYALAVTEPCCGNIGGGGFMLIHLANGQNHFINFREKAPQAISPNLFLDKYGNMQSNLLTDGYLSIGIPGTVMGLNTALTQFGHLSLATVMQPAISLAQQGFTVTPELINSLNKTLAFIQKQPNAAHIFLKNNQPYPVGTMIKQPQLAATLEKIAHHGSAAFYHGDIAEQIVQASQQHHGVMTMADFTHYTVTENQPITCNYRGYSIIAAPPPSSGGVTLCEILNVLQAYPLTAYGFHSVTSTHINLEAMRYAYADRNQYLGDPDFVHNPIGWLLSVAHSHWIRQQIAAYPVRNSKQIGFVAHKTAEAAETTHYSVVDRYGNAVSVTYTLNGNYGSHVIAGNTGFFLNNELDDFAIQIGKPNEFGLIQDGANQVAPNKRPLSSMTPTIITHRGKLFLVLGAPGGSTIITTVLQVIEDVIDFHMSLAQAVNAPRYHMQWLPDRVYMEANAFNNSVLTSLKKMGYQFIVGSPWNTPKWGAVEAIMSGKNAHQLIGATDNRRPGGAVAG